MILFISHSAGRSGAPILLFHLLKWLKSHSQLEFAVLVTDDGPLVDSFRELAETCVVLPPGPASGGRLRRKLRSIRNRICPRVWPALPEAWKHRKWDLIYANTMTNGHLVSKLVRPGTPVITHIHEMAYWIERSGAANWAEVLRQTTRYIAVSEAAKVYLVENKGLQESNIDLVHEFVPAADPSFSSTGDDLRRRLGLSGDTLIVGGSGKEYWRKGRDLFVQLAGAVYKLRPEMNVHFVWVGENTNTEEQFKLAHDALLLGVHSRVHWTGEVRSPGQYFSEFDLFALVSREDPFPLVCLETALLGKPQLCFAGSGGIPELIGDDAGFVVPYLDIGAMAEKVIDLADDRDLRGRLGHRARTKILERHTVDQAGPRVLELIERVIRGAPSGPKPIECDR